MGRPNKYVAENIKNEHRVRHQLRILQSTFKDIKIGGYISIPKMDQQLISKRYMILIRNILLCVLQIVNTKK